MNKTQLRRYKPERLPRHEPQKNRVPLDGDVPVLQFLNTCQNRGQRGAKDYFENYGDFLDWCLEINIVDQEEYNALEFECYCNIMLEADRVFEQVIKAREMLYELVSCLLRGKEVHPQLINRFNAVVNEANKFLHFEL